MEHLNPSFSSSLLPHPVTAGAIVRDAATLFVRRFVPLSVVTLGISVPAGLLTEGIELLLADGLGYVPLTGIFAMKLVSLVISMLATMLGAAAAAVIAYGEFTGRPVSALRAFEAAVHRLRSLLGANLLSGLALGVGFSLLVLPGFIAAAGLCMAVPAIMFERADAFRGVHRAWSVADGYRLRIVLPVLGLSAVALIVTLVGGGVVWLLGTRVGGPAPLVSVAAMVPANLVIAHAWVAVSVMFLRLREARDEAPFEAYAPVFA